MKVEQIVRWGWTERALEGRLSLVSRSTGEWMEAVYAAFACYPLGVVDGCPHCVGQEDHDRIRSASLRDLRADHLGRYAFKAMTTWGTERDYKHFVPRILELAAFDADARGYPGLAPDHVGRKLVDAGFSIWPDEERRVVLSFVHAVWRDAIDRADAQDIESWLEVLASLGEDIDRCLREWREDDSERGTIALAEFVLWCGETVLTLPRREDANAESVMRSRVATWLGAPATRERLEKCVFENPSGTTADRCADAADLLAKLQ